MDTTQTAPKMTLTDLIDSLARADKKPRKPRAVVFIYAVVPCDEYGDSMVKASASHTTIAAARKAARAALITYRLAATVDIYNVVKGQCVETVAR